MLKAKLKKIALQLSGKMNHFKIDVDCNKIWYGNKYAGFYIYPEKLPQNSTVYSFGIGTDISFDLALIKNHNCKVFCFDPTPKSITWLKEQSTPSQLSSFEFGLSAVTGTEFFYLPKNDNHISGSMINQANVNEMNKVSVQMKSLSDIMKELNHDKIDLLKMDIEGAEYAVIENILKSNIKIDQITIEFHDRLIGESKSIETMNLLKKSGYLTFGVSDSFEEISLIHKSCV